MLPFNPLLGLEKWAWDGAFILAIILYPFIALNEIYEAEKMVRKLKLKERIGKD
jgi:hypothetical protein